jgi:hypothetical protein
MRSGAELLGCHQARPEYCCGMNLLLEESLIQ